MLENLRKQRAKRVMGIDCSTHSLAFTVFDNGRPISCGKINFNGADVFERMHDANKKLTVLSKIFDVDYIAFEAAILAKVANADITIKLAMVYGVAIAVLLRQGVKVVTVPPLSWASYIGVPNLKKDEKEQIKKDFPGKSKSWYGNRGREIRKQRIIDWANTWDGWDTADSDVCDSCAIGWYAYNELTHR